MLISGYRNSKHGPVKQQLSILPQYSERSRDDLSNMCRRLKPKLYETAQLDDRPALVGDDQGIVRHGRPRNRLSALQSKIGGIVGGRSETKQIKLSAIENNGGPGRTRTCNQTIMSKPR
jgi:hypothetical protein